jgi:hypothetical protein
MGMYVPEAEKLTPSLEDYLEAVFELEPRRGYPPSPNNRAWLRLR